MKYGQILDQIDDILTKQAFIPAPNSNAGQAMMSQQQGAAGQQPPQGQAQPGSDATGMPQDPAMAQGGVEDGSGMNSDPSQGGDPNAQGAPSQDSSQDSTQGQDKAPKGADGRGDAPPTDMDSTTITLRLRDVLDLVSGGKATQSALKIQQMVNDHTMKTESKARDSAAKEQQKQQQQAQQQAAMSQGGGMMGGQGIYPADPSQGGQQPGMQ